jgi:hypothetical protein
MRRQLQRPRHQRPPAGERRKEQPGNHSAQCHVSRRTTVRSSPMARFLFSFRPGRQQTGKFKAAGKKVVEKYHQMKGRRGRKEKPFPSSAKKEKLSKCARASPLATALSVRVSDETHYQRQHPILAVLLLYKYLYLRLVPRTQASHQPNKPLPVYLPLVSEGMCTCASSSQIWSKSGIAGRK